MRTIYLVLSDQKDQILTFLDTKFAIYQKLDKYSINSCLSSVQDDIHT